MKEPKLTVIVPVYNTADLVIRALDSIPIDDETQLIIVDDGSTDGSWPLILDWWSKHYTGTGSIIHHWNDNRGVAAAMNLGFNLARGEYIVSLSSDDYYVDNFDKFKPYLDGVNDLIYFDLQIDNGEIWHLDEESKKVCVGAVKFIRRDFLGQTRVPDMKWYEDKPFSYELYDKNPKEVFTGILLKHYSFPRVGSLSWQAREEENGRN